MSYQVWVIQHQCLILSLALNLAREKMNLVSWTACCEETFKNAVKMGLTITKHSVMVMNWYQNFRMSRKFRRPLSKKHNCPPFLQQNPDIYTSMNQFGHEHLADLSIELMMEYLHETVLPQMVATEQKKEFVPEKE